MDKKELLEEMSRRLKAGDLHQEEVVSYLGLGNFLEIKQNLPEKSGKHFSFTKILYYLGGAIVFLGIIFFFAQFWYDMSSALRIFVTLGMGLVFAFSGTVLLKQKPENGIGVIFHFIGGMLIPSGALLTLYEFRIDNDWAYAYVFGAVALFYFLLDSKLKHPLLTFFTFTNGTAAAYAALLQTLEELDLSSYKLENDIMAYFSAAVGLFYLLMSFNFKEKWHKTLLGLLNFFGSTWFLVALFYFVTDNGVWLLFYPLIVLGSMFLSVILKSRGILVVSTLALLAYISYITSEFFADSVGWPLSLIFLGFVFIGLGFASVSINKKYIKGEEG